MSTARVHTIDLQSPPVTQTLQQRGFVVGAIFTVLAIVGAVVSPEQFFRSYLVGYMLWLGVTLGCMAFLMIQHVTGGVWGTVTRRMLEAGTRNIGMMAVLFIPIILGMRRLYIWTNADEMAKDPHLVNRADRSARPQRRVSSRR